MPDKVMTANRLKDGTIVYLAEGENWVERLSLARLAQTGESQQALEAAAERAVQRQVVVGPYLIDVEADHSAIRPIGQRERIRACGPTISIAATHQPRE